MKYFVNFFFLIVIYSPTNIVIADEWTFLNSGISSSINKIIMIDELRGYAIGNDDSTAILVRTFDAGMNWELTIINSFHVSSIEVNSDSLLYLAGKDFECNCARIFISDDSGYNWLDNPNLFIENLERIEQISIGQNGLAVASIGNGSILFTDDNFLSHSIINSDFELINIVKISDSNQIYAIGSSTEEESVLLKLENESWEILANLGANTFVSDFSIIGNSIWISANGGSFPHFTRDIILAQGNSPSLDTLLTLPENIGELKGVEFRNENMGFVFTTHGVVYLTNDGGISWTQLESQIPLIETFDVQMINESYGYATGSEGVILRFGTPSNISQVSLDELGVAFPNPAKNSIQFKFDKAIHGEFKIINSIGLVVNKFYENKPQTTIKLDITQLHSGIYYLINSENRIIKFVKI